MCGSVVDECLQLFGGYGYMWITARMYADNRVAVFMQERMKL
jgi:acyl-CoA dehydrogenase